MPSMTDELHWRETYFILFPESRRPSVEKVEHAFASNRRFKLENLAGDNQGLIQSVLIESPEDHAAVEVSYETGDAVVEQNLEWAKQLQGQLPVDQLQLLMTADARLDVAHFERKAAGASTIKSAPTRRPDLSSPSFADVYEEDAYGDDPNDDEFAEEPMEMLDPTCLLTVVDTLASLTHGLTFDPASGEMME